VDLKLKDKIAVVTGAGSKMGKANSYCLCRNGAKVVVSDINEASAYKP
jgi:NAD(P)-dependent dehydrogenase (short-subunit alcohol dehydrogenase family)